MSNVKKEVPDKNTNGKKRNSPDTNKEEPAGGNGSLKRPKRAAACKDFKEKSVRLHEEKSYVVESKKEQVVDEEILAVRLTQGQEEGRPNRRLIDFVVHDFRDTEGNKLGAVVRLCRSASFLAPGWKSGVLFPSRTQ